MANFDTKQWAECYTFYEQIYQESYPYRELIDRNRFLQNPGPINVMSSGLLGFMLCKAERMIACCHYRFDVQHSVCVSEVKFLKSEFVSETAESIQNRLLDICREQSLSVLQMVAENPEVRGYFLAKGRFRKVGQVRESVLDVTQMDRQLLQAWLKNGVGYQIKSIDWNNDKTVNELTAVYNETHADAPFQEAIGIARAREPSYFLEWAERIKAHDLKLLAYGLYYGDNLIGLTMFEGLLDSPKVFSIQYTGILRVNRRQGLGRYLKAASTLLLMQEFPDFRYMVTGNEETNAPMLNINIAMGFQIRSEFTMLRFTEDILPK